MIGENLTFSPEFCNVAVGAFVGQFTVIGILFKVFAYAIIFYAIKRAFDFIMLRYKTKKEVDNGKRKR